MSGLGRLFEPIGRVYRRTSARLRKFLVRLEQETRVHHFGESGSNALAARGASAPENVCIYAIGDVHGRADLLKRLADTIQADADTLPEHYSKVVVFLGDYVDRGFQSRQVIDFLIGDSFDGFAKVFLKGNHEAAFLEFLSNPSFGPQWARFGGAETVISYGIRPPRARTDVDEWTAVSDQLNKELPDEHRSFLQQLDLSVVIGDYAFVHAGMRPGRPIEEQTEEDLLWIRDGFLSDRSDFEQVIVHGHTPISAPYTDRRRIGVDTGAYMSGKLTAVKLAGTEVEFLST